MDLTGGLAGIVTEVAMIPELNLGVIVLTNQEEGGAFRSIVNTIVDSYLNVPQKDWVGSYAELRRKQRADAEKTMAESVGKRATDSKSGLHPGHLRRALPRRLVRQRLRH